MSARVIVTLLLGAASLYLSSGFFAALLMGAAIAVLLYRPYLLLQQVRRISANTSAILVTLGVTILIFVPITLLGVNGVRTGVKSLKNWSESPFRDAPGSDQELIEKVMQIPLVDRLIERAASMFRMESVEVVDAVGEIAKTSGLKIANWLTTALASFPAFAIQMLILTLAIYFSLVDGQRIVRFLRENLIFPREQTEEIFSAFAGICRSVLLATLVSGLVQAMIFLTGMIFAGADHKALLVFVVFFGSFIPLVGAGPVTFGLAAYTLLTAPTRGPGIILLIFALIASISDNFVRPIVLKGGANIHPLIGFVALFGGLQVFGFSGLFLGPIIAGMFIVTLQCLVKANRSAN